MADYMVRYKTGDLFPPIRPPYPLLMVKILDLFKFHSGCYKLRIRWTQCNLREQSREQVKFFVAFLRRVHCYDAIELQVSADQLASLADNTVDLNFPHAPRINVCIHVGSSFPDFVFIRHLGR